MLELLLIETWLKTLMAPVHRESRHSQILGSIYSGIICLFSLPLFNGGVFSAYALERSVIPLLCKAAAFAHTLSDNLISCLLKSNGLLKEMSGAVSGPEERDMFTICLM